MNAAAGRTGGLPWQAILRFGLGRLRLSPHAFWSLSLREFACLAALEAPASPALGRADLEALMARFPDPGKELS